MESPLPEKPVIDRFLEAVAEQSPEQARALLDEHPDLPRQSLHAAAAAGDVAATREWLVRSPALVAAPYGPHGATPLLCLCQSPLHAVSPRDAEQGRRCAELLLDAGADPNTYTLFDASNPDSKISALYWACVNDNVEVVRLLLERGADPNDGESVYHAAELDHRRCLELLLAHGAEISRANPVWGNTPLYFLAAYKVQDPGAPRALAGMRWLLEHGADPNAPSTPKREAPLHRVADHGKNPEAAELLLARGADPAVERADGRTPWALATRAGNLAIAELLERRGGATRDLSAGDAWVGACARGDGEEARRMLAERPELPERLDAEQRGALARAAEEGRPETVCLMASLGFRLEWEGAWCGTALHHAAWRGDAAMTRLLLELGAPLNVRDREFGCSPLAWAAHGSTHYREQDADHAAVVEALLAAGSDRETSINRWNVPPENMASPAVAALLRRHGLGSGGADS